MTFAASEASLDAGTPYELHEFRLGDTATYWRYADAPADVVYGGSTFTACYIRGDKIEAGSNLLKCRTTVLTAWDNVFAAQYMTYGVEQIVHYVRYKGHGADVTAVYRGDVVGVAFTQRSRQGEDRHAEIQIDPLTAALRRSGLCARYSRICDAELYSARCGVVRATYKTSGTLSAAVGAVLTSATFGGQADGYWIGGDVVVGDYRRMIVDHSGNNIRVHPVFPDLAGDESFDVYAGCDHTYATCKARFSNGSTFPGQPDIPDDDPSSPYGFV